MAKAQIAIRDLFVGIHRAHRKGDSVPAENVEPNGWTDDVATEGTKAANTALKERAEEDGSPVEEQPAAATTGSGSSGSRSS